MKRGFTLMPSIAAAAAMSAAALAGAGIPITRDEAPQMPPPTKKKTKRRRSKAAPFYFTTRGKYIPGGEYRNCGERGISPKSYERVLAAWKKRKGVKNPKMKEN